MKLFGKGGLKDGDVISMAEHGRVGGVSTGQPFKFVSNIDPNTGKDQLSELIPVFRELLLVMANPAYVDKSANQMRAQVTGSVTATVASTTISTIDGYNGKLLMVGINNDAWANTCRRLIT